MTLGDGPVVLLLRGVNVGGHRLVMAEVRAVLERAGARAVTTYLQSGNVVLDPPASARPDVAGWAEPLLAALAGYDVPVVVRTHAELVDVVARNPFPGASGTTWHVAFHAQDLPAGLPDAIERVAAGATPSPEAGGVTATDAPNGVTGERCVVSGREIFYHLPNGMGRARLPVLVERATRAAGGPLATVRNGNTVTRLAAASDH